MASSGGRRTPNAIRPAYCGKDFSEAPNDKGIRKGQRDQSLTQRDRELFAVEYVKDYDAVSAARRAFGKGLRCSKPQGGNNGLTFKVGSLSLSPVKMVNVCEYEIKMEEEKKAARFNNKAVKDMTPAEFETLKEDIRIEAADVIREIAKIAFTDVAAPENSPSGKGRLVSTTEKLKALDMLAKHFGVYERDNEQKAAQNRVLQVMWIGAERGAEQTEESKIVEALPDETYSNS